MTFNELYKQITENRQNSIQGYKNCIPFQHLSRLKPILPGIIKGEYYLITGNSGSAKSKLARTLFINDPYVYVKSHPELDIKLDILYWPLEEGEDKIYSTELSRMIKNKYNIVSSYRQLRSIGEQIQDNVYELLPSLENEFNEWKEHIHVFGGRESNPFGIYKAARDFCYKHGRFYNHKGESFTDEMMDDMLNSKGDWFKDIAGFRFNHPRHYVIIMVDHISLIKTEGALNLTQSIYKLSTEYLLALKNLFGCIPVIVQQQNSKKEEQKYTSSGSSIEEKLEPSLDALADCTTTQREATVAFGIFAPNRYDITEHNGYDITILKDHYRSLSLLKQRDDRANVKLPLFFQGESDYFNEMPRLDEKDKLNKVYEYAKTLKR